MARKFNHERAASVLVDAAYHGDEEAAAKWGLTTRTIQNYRRRLATDTILSQFFAQKKLLVESEWKDETADAIREAARFCVRSAKEADHKDPDVINAVGSFYSRLVNAAVMREILNARLHGSSLTD